MAISQGVGPHTAILHTAAGSFPIERGNVTQEGSRKTSTFSVAIPRNYPGAMALDSVDDLSATISVTSTAGAGQLISGQFDTGDFDFTGGYIRVTGADNSRDLHQIKVSQKWLNQPGSAIVQQLVGQAGLSARTNSSSLLAGKKINQDFVKLADNVPISYVINRLAEFDAARWWVHNGVFNYATFGTTQGAYTVNVTSINPLVSDALSLKVRRNWQASKNWNVTVKSWHPRDKQVYTGTSNIGGRGSAHATYHVPGLDQAHANQHAKARAAEMARHRITLTAILVGDPNIDAGMGLKLSGSGAFDDVYEIDSISHEFGMSGYTMTVVAKSIDNVSGN